MNDATRLVWDNARGLGYLDPGLTPFGYDTSYFRSYVVRDATDMGEKLTAARVGLVAKYTPNAVLDVGIGGGRFVASAPFGSKGYDINPDAVRWLQHEGIWGDLYAASWPVATFWDALEHIPTPEKALARCSDLVFVSLPVFTSRANCAESKHFKPGEHIWYFTETGFVAYMFDNGFRELERNTIESDLGREGITTFVFQRVA